MNSVFLKVGGPSAFFPDHSNRAFRFPSGIESTALSFHVEGAQVPVQ